MLRPTNGLHGGFHPDSEVSDFHNITAHQLKQRRVFGRPGIVAGR